MPGDLRVTMFALALTFAVTLLFGLAPALRASAITPASALKSGDATTVIPVFLAARTRMASIQSEHSGSPPSQIYRTRKPKNYKLLI